MGLEGSIALSFIAHYWVLGVILVSGAWLIRNRYYNGLNEYPGPFMASLTDLWRLWDVWGRQSEVTHRKLHAQYGDVSDFYIVQQGVSKGRGLATLFSTTDNTFHAQLRRCVNSAFSMSALVQYEPFVNNTLKLFFEQTERLYVNNPEGCDFVRWLQFYAFDVIDWANPLARPPVPQEPHLPQALGVGDRRRDQPHRAVRARTHGRAPGGDGDRHGHVEAAAAHHRHGEAAGRQQQRRQPVGGPAVQVPGGARLAARVHERQARARHGRVDGVRGLRDDGHLAVGRLLQPAAQPLGTDPPARRGRRRRAPGAFADYDLGVVTWAESQRLPYLDACIKEAFRMHPAAGLPLERIVPEPGMEIAGRYVKGGTIVGCSAWLIHRRPEIFGPDVDVYRPERWLLDETLPEAQREERERHLREMNGHMFQFGMGARTCIGKNISLLEMYKLVPSLLRRFEIRFKDPSQDWKTVNAWFIKQQNFKTLFERRELILPDGQGQVVKSYIASPIGYADSLAAVRLSQKAITD
ncbi:hypothetical protein CIB48_g5852 [Xylaria polymorpha]|nr:hypothetical protein CIB48_g5852 [Xylaria polymorpha]